MKILLLLLLLSCSVSAAKLSDYTTPNDNLDDSVGFQQAINDMPKGGTLIIDKGVWNLKATVDLTSPTDSTSLVLKGDKGSVLKPHLEGPVFIAGRHNQLIMEDLTVLGDLDADADFGKFLYIDSTSQFRMTGCQFFGLASSSLLHIKNVDAVIKDTLFHGLATSEAVILAEEFRGLSIIDSEFADYGNYDGTYYSKTPFGDPAWVKATATSASPTEFGQRIMHLQNVRIDEGAFTGFDISGVSYVQAEGIMANTNDIGILLNNVKYAEVKMSKFGHNTNPKPAIRAVNNSTVYVDGITLGAGIYYGERDQSSQSFFNLKSCSSGCAFQVL